MAIRLHLARMGLVNYYCTVAKTMAEAKIRQHGINLWSSLSNLHRTTLLAQDQNTHTHPWKTNNTIIVLRLRGVHLRL